MKLVCYQNHTIEQPALLVNGKIYCLTGLNKHFPATMNELLDKWSYYIPLLYAEEKAILRGQKDHVISFTPEQMQLMAPVPYPGSCRDGYAFRKHVAAARRNRNLEMIREFDQYPVFYFTNHRSIQGPGDIICMPDHFEKLDYELEAAIVICKKGRNIKAEEADDYIGGLMIMNDLSARTMQIEEMLLNLGPAKGKDFATAIGP